MCSSLPDIGIVKKAVRAGCKYYIIKPFRKEHLLGKVRDAFEQGKPILKNKNEIMSQLGVDEVTYQELARTSSCM
jgi:response regulator of citrate/malate metabolism